MMEDSKSPATGTAHTKPASKRHYRTGTGGPTSWTSRFLHQHSYLSDPMGEEFNYAEEFKKLDLKALKEDLYAIMTKSQDWWPADFVAPLHLFIRMACRSAAPAACRVGDGRGGAGNGHPALCPAQQLARQCQPGQGAPPALAHQAKIWQENFLGRPDDPRRQLRPGADGLKTFGFGGGRQDVWEPDEDVYWGAEGKWLDEQRYSGDRALENPLANVQMGLIYVNPEGPNGNPDPLAAARISARPSPAWR